MCGYIYAHMHTNKVGKPTETLWDFFSITSQEALVSPTMLAPLSWDY